MSLIDEFGLINNQSGNGRKVTGITVRRPVYSRNNHIAGSCYQLRNTGPVFSDTLMPRQRQVQRSLASFLHFLKLMERDSYRNHHLLGEQQKLDNIYFLELDSQLIVSACVCHEIVQAARRMSDTGARLAVLACGGVSNDRRQLRGFCHNFVELSEEGVRLGMRFEAYTGEAGFPAFVLDALDYLFLNPFSIGMPSQKDNVNYADLMCAGEVVRDIHNHLDIKLVATHIQTQWQERVVKSLPVHYLLGDYYGNNKEVSCASL